MRGTTPGRRATEKGYGEGADGQGGTPGCDDSAPTTTGGHLKEGTLNWAFSYGAVGEFLPHCRTPLPLGPSGEPGDAELSGEFCLIFAGAGNSAPCRTGGAPRWRPARARGSDMLPPGSNGPRARRCVSSGSRQKIRRRFRGITRRSYREWKRRCGDCRPRRRDWQLFCRRGSLRSPGRSRSGQPVARTPPLNPTLARGAPQRRHVRDSEARKRVDEQCGHFDSVLCG